MCFFRALPATKTDGACFVEAAISSGAGRDSWGDQFRRKSAFAVPFRSRTSNPRRALALAAATFYPRQPAHQSRRSPAPAARPRSRLSRGKSGNGSGTSSASIGTIGLVSPRRTIYWLVDGRRIRIALHRQLDEIANDGVTHLALEASSHGLDQYRLDGVRIAAGWVHQPVARTTWITILMSRITLHAKTQAVPRSCRGGWRRRVISGRS